MNDRWNIAAMDLPHLTLVAAARPNFMKVGPVLRALDGRVRTTLVHTGQHYDDHMSRVFFEELGLPRPDVNLGVGSGTHAAQTAAVMVDFERHLRASPTDAVVVVGDVNSTLAASLVATKMGVPVAHVEAGLRSGDWAMPEEVNRVLTDRMSRWLFTPSPDADANLRSEGIPVSRIHRVGNVMIDTLIANLGRARARGPILRHQLGDAARHLVLTLHRPSNVDDPAKLMELITAVANAAPDLPIVFPVHPRTAAQLEGLERLPANLRCLPPLSYLDFVGLVDSADLVLTDSGGIQEETSVLGVPCLTIRDSTERPVTCELGTNRLIGVVPAAIEPAVRQARMSVHRPARIPMWDGRAAERVAHVLVRDLERARLSKVPA
ncbi:MAG TPA: UDP-N-acetylglucosamine 2-epimerase (non-hydrolyzing) [Acidimicrobiales bacterium]|nr:UDP-N-acetylglucosamine 2-epimerase (non-hydrolyzing) [Acidimicrobiales bacterium]